MICAVTGGYIMDAQAVIQFISNVGFPIACCCYLAYSNERLRQTIDDNTKTIDALKTMFTLYFNKHEGGN